MPYEVTTNSNTPMKNAAIERNRCAVALGSTLVPKGVSMAARLAHELIEGAPGSTRSLLEASNGPVRRVGNNTSDDSPDQADPATGKHGGQGFLEAGVAVTPDGKIISADSVGLVRVWQRQGKGLDRWEVVGEWELPGPVWALALARDGKHVATANSDGTVYILRLPAPAPRK
jgi:hypothetical protein